MEIWKDIKGYEGYYQISNLGRVMVYQSKKILAQCKQTNGYFIVNLYKNNISKCPLIHRLIAAHFIPIPESKLEVNHINGIKTDNRIENLEWCTRAENAAHAGKNNLMRSGINHRCSKLTIEDVLFIHFNKHLFSASEMSKILNKGQVSVYAVIRGTTWNKVTRINKIYKSDRLRVA